MQTSKKVWLTSILALSVAGGAASQLLAATNAPADGSSAQSTQAAQGLSKISELGMTAISDIRLARLAINDGYTDKAGQLLGQARTLLDQVEKQNPPVTVHTEVKVGDQPAQEKSVTGKPNMIPILSEMGIIEAIVPADAEAASTSSTGSGKPADAENAGKGATDQPGPDSARQSAAIAKAKTQLQQGATQAAAATLETVELALVSRVVSMPLKQTSQHLDQARDQLKESKFHEANLSLKAIEDSLVIATESVIEPVAALAPTSGDGGQDGDSGT